MSRDIVLDVFQVELTVGERAFASMCKRFAVAREPASSQRTVCTQRRRPALSGERFAIGRCPRAIVRYEVDKLAAFIELERRVNSLSAAATSDTRGASTAFLPVQRAIDQRRRREHTQVVQDGHSFMPNLASCQALPMTIEELTT
ncbi:MAG: hypothetical protein RL701_3694, partial [Pseudomonadota bacterium]